MTEEADLAGFLESGVSILGASAGEDDLVPEAFRAWGAKLNGDGLLRVLVNSDAARTYATVGPGSRLCFTFSDPLTFRSLQVKGHVVAGPEAPGPADIALMRRYGKALAAASTQRGVAAELVEATRPVAVFAVVLRIDERYDQTPGVGAGRRLDVM